MITLSQNVAFLLVVAVDEVGVDVVAAVRGRSQESNPGLVEAGDVQVPVPVSVDL